MRCGWLAAVLWAAGAALAGPADEALQAGLAALRAGRAEAALAKLDAALAAEPEHLVARYWRARAEAELGRWQAAVDDLIAVVRGKPESVASWLDLGRAYQALGRGREARSAAEQVLALEPGNRDAKAVLKLLDAGAPAAAKPPRASEPSQPDIGWRMAVEPGGLRVADSSVGVESRQVYDYTFGAAPTDWEPLGGEWAITSRFACEPEWSFFGGQGRGICALWNKRLFTGDLAVEAYVSFKHGLPWADERWFYVPSDLDINLFSRRGDLSSGYSFIYSGLNGSTTMIRRGDKVLCATTDDRFRAPQFSDDNPLYQADEQGRPYGVFHRRWWRLEARRVGSRLIFLVDGEKALQADDPGPPADGQVALWTMGSGMMVARIRIAYEHEVVTLVPKVTAERPAALPDTG
ncbi:MAG: tetratricopeptide repeat protein [Armatimonadetes bacterium]|nr:tetratricopeptide repeat protein [Armatimonadota bacterium]